MSCVHYFRHCSCCQRQCDACNYHDSTHHITHAIQCVYDIMTPHIFEYSLANTQYNANLLKVTTDFGVLPQITEQQSIERNADIALLTDHVMDTTQHHNTVITHNNDIVDAMICYRADTTPAITSDQTRDKNSYYQMGKIHTMEHAIQKVNAQSSQRAARLMYMHSLL